MNNGNGAVRRQCVMNLLETPGVIRHHFSGNGERVSTWSWDVSYDLISIFTSFLNTTNYPFKISIQLQLNNYSCSITFKAYSGGNYQILIVSILLIWNPKSSHSSRQVSKINYFIHIQNTHTEQLVINGILKV